MIWHHKRRKTHKRLAPRPVPTEGMMFFGNETVPINELEDYFRQIMKPYDNLPQPIRDYQKVHNGY